MNPLVMVLLFASKYGRSFQHYSIRKNVKATFMTFRSKFAEPTNDLVFKKLFVESSVLVDFINKVLPTKHVKNVEYIPTNMDPDVRTKRRSMIDVLCTDENGSKYIVAMQNAKKYEFNESYALDYASKTYGSQLNKGGKYSDLLEVIFIVITDFVMFRDNTKYFSTSTIRDTETDQHTLKNFTFIFIEIPKYKEYENAEGIDEWIDLFKTASSRKNFQTSNPMIKKAYELLEFTDWTDQELLDFERYKKILLDNKVRSDRIYDEARAEGFAIGFAKVKAEGKAEGIADLVKAMLRRNFDVDTISKTTGISHDEIRRLGLQDS